MSKKSGAADGQSKAKLAENVLWCAYCVACELHSAQAVLDQRFRWSERTRQWQYDYEPFATGSPEAGFTMQPTAVAWLDVVEVLGRFREALTVAVKALPDLHELMDSENQAIPDWWTFRVRLMLGELEGIYSHEHWERVRLKNLGEPEEKAGEAMFRRPMGEDALRRFWELCERFKMRCAECGLATDTSGDWKIRSAPVRGRRDSEADNAAIRSAIGRLIGSGKTRTEITIAVLEREANVPDHAIFSSNAWKRHMEERRCENAIPSAKKAGNPADQAIERMDWEEVARQQRAEEESPF